MFKKVLCILISLSVVFATFSGCQKTDVKPEKASGQTLTISYCDGKYGSEWIKAIVSAYKIKNPDVTIKLTPDPNLDQKAGNLLESDINVPDILFLSNTNWQNWASKGYMADLTGLYNTIVDDKKSVLSKIQPDYLNHCKYKDRYWILPWDDGVTGFAYNKTLFEQNGWKVPTKMSELNELLPQIKAKGIIPIAWDGKNIADWSFAVNNWWAQGEGKKGMNAYLKLDSPKVYLQAGRANALKQFQSLVSDTTNSFDNVITADSSKAESEFFGSRAAMLLCGSWIESKAGSAVPKDFKMAMMRVPAVDDAVDANINVAAAGGFAVIPSVSKNMGLAKDFLRFMSTDEMLELYTKVTSSPRPFVYDAEGTEGLSDFGKSVIDIWQAHDNFYMFSNNPLYYNVFADWPKDGVPYMQIYSGLITPDEAVDDNYDYVKDNWKSAAQNSSK